MKKSLILCLMVLTFIGIRLNVSADEAATYATPSDNNYSEMQSLYNKYNNGGKISVIGEQIVTIYGRSICSGNSCTYNYAGLNVGQDFTSALSKTVTCSNGINKISYSSINASAKNDFLDKNEAKVNGTVYWSEQYHVTCTNNGSIEVEKEQEAPNNGGNVGATDVDNNQGGNTSGGEYNTSTPEENPGTGVSTYFVVLGLVAIVSYICMILVKKHNLFKKI